MTLHKLVFDRYRKTQGSAHCKNPSVFFFYARYLFMWALFTPHPALLLPYTFMTNMIFFVCFTCIFLWGLHPFHVCIIAQSFLVTPAFWSEQGTKIKKCFSVYPCRDQLFLVQREKKKKKAGPCTWCNQALNTLEAFSILVLNQLWTLGIQHTY